MIIELRKRGFLFREIGEIVDESAAYARILHADALKRLRSSGEVFAALSTKARKCLLREGFRTKREVIEAIRIGWLHPKRQSKYGPTTHAEVCRWAGVPNGVQKNIRYDYLRVV